MNYLTKLFPRKRQPITICRAYSDRKISKRDSSDIFLLYLCNIHVINCLNTIFQISKFKHAYYYRPYDSLVLLNALASEKQIFLHIYWGVIGNNRYFCTKYQCALWIRSNSNDCPWAYRPSRRLSRRTCCMWIRRSTSGR